jgi:hypothetical protein
MLASKPTAVIKHVFKCALNATLAALRATLKPLSGRPSLLHMSAFAMSRDALHNVGAFFLQSDGQLLYSVPRLRV